MARAAKKPAAKKPGRPKASRKSASNGQAPEATVEFDGARYKRFGSSFGTIWPNETTEEDEYIDGTVTSLREVPNRFYKPAAGKRPAQGNPTQMLCEIQDSDGNVHTVFESSQTRDFLNAVQIGDNVRLEYHGTVQIKGRKEPMKAISCYIAE